MMRTVRGWLCWVLVGLSVAFTIAAVFLWVDGAADLDVLSLVIATVLVLFPVAGALVVRRSAGNVFGWIFLAIGLSWSLQIFTGAYLETRVLTGRSSGELADFLTWIYSWTGALVFGTGAVVLMLFPTGKPVSAKWRPAFWLVMGSLVFLTLGLAFSPGELDDFPQLNNPYGIEGAGFLDVLTVIGWFGMLVGLVLAAASMVVRFRRSRGEERQQLKWVLLASVILMISSVSWLISEELGALATAVGLGALPIAIAIAILKYRLYDIDVVINRALVYGSLTALLALIYGGIVAGASVLAGRSDVTVAAATLAVAGAFRPLRRWVQDFIDRRFYRRKFDVQQTIDGFSAVVRNAIDLPTLTNELASVVNKTMHPRSVSLWVLAATTTDEQSSTLRAPRGR
jgi:hypothetical protein